MKLLRILYLFLIICNAISSNAQEPVSIHLTDKDGLPDIEFYSMKEDKEGFIWFASDKGLHRYDGKVFKQFSHPDKKGRSLFNLKIGPEGRVWCNNIAGQFFYVENNKLVLFNDYQKELKGQLADYIFFNKKLLIRQRDNILSVNIKTKEIKSIYKNANTTSIGITMPNQYLFLNRDNNIVLLDTLLKKSSFKLKTKENITFFSHFTKANNKVFIAFRDNILNRSLLVSVDIEHKSTTQIKLPKKIKNSKISRITNINNQLYLATNKGVFITESHQGKLILITHFLKDKMITDIIEDKNNIIWVATLKNGVFVIPNKNLKQFNTFKNVQIIEQKNDSICYLAKRNGELLELNIKTNKLHKNLIIDETPIRALDYNKSNNTLLYFSDYQNLVYSNNYSKKKEITKFGSIKSVAFVNDTTFLISSSSGTKIVNPKNNYTISNIRSHESIYSVINRKIFLADVEGLKVYDENYLKEPNITYKNKPIYGFNIVETNNGLIWVATYDNGILGIKNNKVIYHLNETNGLASNDINCITADNEGLWISTDKGLQYYNSNLNEVKVLTKQDGINSYKIKDLEILGDFLIYTNNLGVYGFNKTKIFKQKEPPSIYLTKISIQEKPVEIKNKYVLDHNKSNVDISFNTKEFQSVKHIIYEYKFAKDKDWTILREEVDFVKFINLAPGNYIFQLRAKNKFSKNYSKTIELNFEVLAPIYQRWWFILIGFLLIVLLTITYVNTKTKRLKRLQAKELEKERISKALVFSQLENLRSQMNPHFIFNALNSIQDYIILNEKKLARQYLVKFSRLIRTYLEHSQETNITLEEEIKALKLYLELEKDRFNNELIFTIFIDDEINTKTIFVPSLFIQPYVENAIKHGLLHKKGSKILNLNFSLNSTNKKIICVVDDNGIGRNASEIIKNRTKFPKSFATKANQKRIDLINSTTTEKIEIEVIDKVADDNKPTGTKIILTIPIQ